MQTREALKSPWRQQDCNYFLSASFSSIQPALAFEAPAQKMKDQKNNINKEKKTTFLSDQREKMQVLLKQI